MAAVNSRNLTVISALLCQDKTALKEIRNMFFHLVVIRAYMSSSSVS